MQDAPEYSVIGGSAVQFKEGESHVTQHRTGAGLHAVTSEDLNAALQLSIGGSAVHGACSTSTFSEDRSSWLDQPMVTGASFSTGALVLGRFLRPNGGGRAANFVALSFEAPPLRGVPNTGAFGFAFGGCGGGFARPGAEPAPEPVVTAMPARQICASQKPRDS